MVGAGLVAELVAGLVAELAAELVARVPHLVLPLIVRGRFCLVYLNVLLNLPLIPENIRIKSNESKTLSQHVHIVHYLMCGYVCLDILLRTYH